MSVELGVAAASLVVGLLLQPLLIPRLRRLGVMDVPNHRSSHVVSTPRSGGLAVVVALGAGLLMAPWSPQVLIAYAGCVLLGALGLVDDFRGLDARVRLALLLIVGGLAGAVLDSPVPILLAVPAMALWTATYVNAFNFMDGINGISALTGAVVGASYWVMGWEFVDPSLAVLGAALCGASLAFLPYNAPRARVFLGDVGSYAMGFAVAALAWMAWDAGAPAWLAAAPTLVYLTDTGATLFRRWRRGAPLMEAHREHAYQRLVVSGRSHVQVASAVAVLQLGVVFMAWSAWASGLRLLAVVALPAMLAGYLAIAQRQDQVIPTYV